MIAILNILIFLIFFIFLVGLNLRIARQVRSVPISEFNILIMLFILGVNIIFVGVVCLSYELVHDPILIGNILLASLGGVSLSSIALSVLVVMGLITSKKVKTLLRLPLIGALAGFYLKDERVLYLFVVIELILTVYFFMNRDNYNYAFRQQVKGLLSFIVFVLLFENNFLPYSLIGFLFFVLMKNQIINQIRLKLVLEKSQNEI